MRSRNIKPGFWTNEDLGALPIEARLLFVGLWCYADREGRCEDRPARIRVAVLPYDPNVDCDALLAMLAERGFVTRYQVDGTRYLQINNFTVHQSPHHTERQSEIPPPHGELTVNSPEVHRSTTVDIAPEPLNPRIPESQNPDIQQPNPKGYASRARAKTPANGDLAGLVSAQLHQAAKDVTRGSDEYYWELVDRIMALTEDGDSYRHWWRIVVGNIDERGALDKLLHWLKYTEDCGDPSKDLGQAKSSARLLTSRVLQVARECRAAIPKGPWAQTKGAKTPGGARGHERRAELGVDNRRGAKAG